VADLMTANPEHRGHAYRVDSGKSGGWQTAREVTQTGGVAPPEADGRVRGLWRRSWVPGVCSW